MILADPHNPTAQKLREALVDRLPEAPHDLIVVVGGDGFMLHTIGEHGFDRVYLGLNAGRVGFLLNDVDDLDRAVQGMCDQAYTVYDFPILQATLTCSDGSTSVVHAVNDISLERTTGQTAHLGLSINGRPVVETLVSDGIIFSTALGSTAYTFSAGGPACHPTLPTLLVTAICPHAPRLSPFLLHETAHASVEVQAAHRRPVRAVADGQTLEGVVGAEVRLGRQRVHLAWLEGHDFTSQMVTKILRP